MYLFPLKSDNILNHHLMLKHKHDRFLIILELKFGTKRKNRKLCPIFRTSGIESNHSGYRSEACTSNFQWNVTHEITYTGPLNGIV